LETKAFWTREKKTYYYKIKKEIFNNPHITDFEKQTAWKLFRKTFKERNYWKLGHYCELGDGKFSLTAGWNSIQAIYGTEDWLGYKSENQKVTMRVMDFYHHDEGKIRENWVPIDIIHILKQIGVDVLESIKK